MNFFENFGRVNTTSISKIAVKSHKFCVKNLLDTRLRLLPVFSVNKGSPGGGGGGGGGGGVVKDFTTSQREGYIASVTDHYKGGGRRAKFSPTTALRNV